MRRPLPFLAALLALVGPASGARAESPPATSTPPAGAALSLAALPDEDHLAALLWEQSAEFAAVRARIAATRADLIRAHVLPNPTLDVSMNTIPIGATNPPGLRRWAEVPNYAFGLSELVELGKRGPRQDSARAALAASALDAQATLRARTYDVMDKAADVAATELRLAQLQELADDAAKLTELQRVRQRHGDAAGLDVDRSVLEEESLQTSLGEEHARLSDALLACAQTAGMPCQPFGGRTAAAAFLEARLARAPSAADIESRPDLRSLSAQEDSARAALTLARRHWVPDPTVRAGYVRDQFVIAGNQLNSLFVGLSIPLPFFDHGQADAHAASAAMEAARVSREKLAAQSARDASTLASQLAALRERRERLRNQTLPMAAGVVQRLDAAVRAGGAALQDLLLARRTYGELLLHAADLDQGAFHVSTGLDRAHSAGPRAPESLTEPRS
ncbi:TolC family protein [Corallococcus sp. H22C18031201]|uniref:TolC family protein n=1 Tax=Citreicoccus inhibens TaxID=2849499 RepID=UPI000E74428B|nr:TolC family protein [Citreicoccus inhibens]MBU8896268.1 TolC family protein [Citreicoccus inhibens]RJS17397.1 TolC family protein [Corallococcus sp. H22C18031201]